MAVMGDQKQEHKLAEMGALAKQVYPEVNILAVKGALRQGAQKALQKYGYADWKDLSGKPPAERELFFDHLIQEAQKGLAAALGPENVDQYISMVKRFNKKYTLQ